MTPTTFNRGVAFFGALIIGASIAAASLTTSGNVSVGGDASVVGNTTSTTIAVASGRQVNLLNSAVASLNFPAIKGGECQALTVTVTGASTSTGETQSVAVGVLPSVVESATATSWWGYVSAPNTVKVVGCNGSKIEQPDLPAANFRASVIGFDI